MLLLNQSKEELNLNKKTNELMYYSIQTADNVLESLASSVTYFGDSVKDRLALLAQSFAQNSLVTNGRPIYNLPNPMEHSFSTSSIQQGSHRPQK